MIIGCSDMIRTTIVGIILSLLFVLFLICIQRFKLEIEALIFLFITIVKT